MNTEITHRHVIADDGLTVLDPVTALTWTRSDVGDGRMTYAKAESAIAALNAQHYAGHNDWRIPTVDELFQLADRKRFSPAINTDAFPTCASELYWSSTPDAEEPASLAWAVGFSYGYAVDRRRGYDCRVRAVRGPVRQ